MTSATVPRNTLPSEYSLSALLMLKAIASLRFSLRRIAIAIQSFNVLGYTWAKRLLQE
jgi:hypothetical protein